MPDIESMEIIGDAEPTLGQGPGPSPGPGPEPARSLRDRATRLPPRRLLWLLAAPLAAALVAVVVLAGVLYGDRRQTTSQRAAVAAATAWARAVDRHDVAAVQASVVPGARAVLVGPTGVLPRPFRGQPFVTDGRLTYDRSLRLAVLSDPDPVHDLQVAMTTRLTCDEGTFTQLAVLNLQRVGDEVRVASAVLTATPGTARAADADSA